MFEDIEWTNYIAILKYVHFIPKTLISNYLISIHRIIRYEDFSLDIWNQSLELLKFTRRNMSSEVKSFIYHHTSTTKFEGM